MCFGKHTKKRNDRVEKGLDSVYGKDDNPIRKLKRKLRCIQTCGIVWLFLAIILIAAGGTLLYFFIDYLNTTGDWHIYLTYSGIAAVSLGGLMLILGIITLVCFCHLVKKQQNKLSGKPVKQKKGASLKKQYPVGTYPAQKEFSGKPPGHLPPIDPDEVKKGKDGKKKKKKKKKQVDPEQGYQVNADTEEMIRPDYHGGVHSGRMDLLNEGIEEAIEPERSHVAHSVPGGSGIYEEPDVIVQTHRGEVNAEPIGFEADGAAGGMSYAQKEAAAHAARQRHVESQAKQREHDTYERQKALEQEWQDYEAGKDGRYSNQGRPIIPPLKSARGPALSSGYAGRQDVVEDQLYAEVDRGVHAAAPGTEYEVQTTKHRRSPPHYGKHSRVSPAPDQPMAMHVGPTKSTHHTSQDVQGADIPTQPIIQHQPQYLPFGFQPMMPGQTPGQPEMPYKIFMVAPANTGQPMMMPYPYYMQPMPQTMPMAQPMMAPMYDPHFMQQQSMTAQPPTYQQMQPGTHQTHSKLGRLESEEAVVPSVQETVHSAPTAQLHLAPPPVDHKTQTDKRYKELDQDALRALDEFERVYDSTHSKQGQRSSASSVSEEALEETRENVVESAIDMDEMLQKLEEMDKPKPQKQTTIDMTALEKLVALNQSQNESVDPGLLGDASDVEEVMEETHEVQIESAIDIDAMLQKLEEMDAQKAHKVDYGAESEEDAAHKKKHKKKKKTISDEEDEDNESESGYKKKKKKSKRDDEDSGDEKAKKKKKKKKKGSEDEKDFESEGESDSNKKKKSKKDKDGKKKKRDKKEHQEEVIAAANVAAVESGVDMDAFTRSDKNTRSSGEENMSIHLHGKPDATEKAMVAKLELLERRVHFVEESVHIDSDEELITSSRSLKVEHAPAPSYDNEEGSDDMDVVQKTQSAPVEHPPPSFVNSWNETAKEDLASDDDDIIMPVKTRQRVRPAIKPRTRFQKDVEVEAPVMSERREMIETTPSGHGELQLDDVDGFDEDEVITVQRTTVVESAPIVFPMTAPSAGVPEIKVTEVESFDDQDVITAEHTQQIESSPIIEEVTHNVIKETESAPMISEENLAQDKHDLEFHTEAKDEFKMVEGGDELIVMETAPAVEAVPVVIGEKKEKKKSKKGEDKTDEKKDSKDHESPSENEKKKKKKKDKTDEKKDSKDQDSHSENEKKKKKKKKAKSEDEDENSENEKSKKSEKKKKKKPKSEDEDVNSENEKTKKSEKKKKIKKKGSDKEDQLDSGDEHEKKKKKSKAEDVDDQDTGDEKAKKKKKKKGADEEGAGGDDEKKKKKKKKSKMEDVDETSEDEKTKKKKKKKKDSAGEEDLDSENDKKRASKTDKSKKKKKEKEEEEEAIAALSLHSDFNQESKGQDEVVSETSAVEHEAAPIALEAGQNLKEEKKNKKTKKEKKEKKEKTKKKKKKGDEVEDEGFGILAPINARYAPRPLDGGTSPEHTEKSPEVAKMEESAIDEVVTIETAVVVEATPGVLDAQLEIETPEKSENLRSEVLIDREDVTQVESVPPIVTNTKEEVIQAQEAPLAESGAYESVIQAHSPVHESSPEDLLPSAVVATNLEPEPEIKMAASAPLESGYVGDVMDFREEPKVESSQPMAERSVGILDLKSASEDKAIDGKDASETPSVVEEVSQIETVPQVENSVDILDLKQDPICGTSVVVSEKEATKDVVEDVLTVESVPEVHRSVDILDEDIGKPPIGRSSKQSVETTRLDKNVDILIIGDHDEKDLVLANTSEIPEKAKIEVVPDVVPVTAEIGTKDGAVVAGITEPKVDTANLASETPNDENLDHTIKMRSDHAGLLTKKEESVLLKDRQSPTHAAIGKPESAPPGGDLDNDSLDDFFGSSDVTHLLGGDESGGKGNENSPTISSVPPSRFGATGAKHIDVNGDAENSTAAGHKVSPPRGDQLNDSMNNFLASDRQASKRDSLDDGGFWDKRDARPSHGRGRRNRPVDIFASERPHHDENGNKAPSVDKAKHDSADDLEPLAVPSGSEDNDSVDGVIMWDGDKKDLLQTMKQPKDSDFNTTAFVSRNGSDDVTSVRPFKMESDSEEDILSPMMRKNKKTFITQSKS